jgi:hypothetical protein
MAFTKISDTLGFDEPGVLRFIRNSSILRSIPLGEKMSTAVRRAIAQHPVGNEKPEPDRLWFDFSSGERIRTTDLRVMSKDPKSVPFVRRVLQTLAIASSAGVSQTGERWFSQRVARHAAVVD